MIKLKFYLPNPVEKTFSSPRVVIGSQSPDIAGVGLDEGLLQPEHVILTEEASQFWVANGVNDPFVTLNGRPFGRKLIHNGDRLAIDELQIAFEGRPSSPVAPLSSVESLLETKIQQKQDSTVEEAEEEGWLDHGVARRTGQAVLGTDTEVYALLAQVEALEEKTALVRASLIEESIPIQEPVSAPAPVVAEFLESPVTPVSPPPLDELPKPSRSLDLVRTLVMSLGLTSLLMLFAAYMAFSDQTGQEEFIAAQDVADVSMALTYAQLHQVKPKHQNWADPEFIKLNLEKMLDGRFETALDLNAQGYLRKSPYMLRVYTNTDLSQFLLVAQPSASIWHWFTQQHSILLDSAAMELRMTTDLRALNRLMANPAALEGVYSLEVSKLVSDADLIPLRRLARETGRPDFRPPQELKVLRPGTEDLVENAPRYYRLTEPIVDALALIDNEVSEEVRNERLKSVKASLESFSRLPNLVLYTSADAETAESAAHALKKHFPTEKWLVGYLVFDEITGSLRSTQLIDGSSEAHAQTHASASPVREGHPLLQVLHSLAERRRGALEPLNEEMFRLVQEQRLAPSEQFYSKMAELLARYHLVDGPNLAQVRAQVSDIYLGHVVKDHQLSREEFRHYAVQAGLDSYLPEEPLVPLPPPPPTSKQLVPPPIILTPPNLEAAIRKIQEARSLAAMESAVTAARQSFTRGSFATAEEYQAYRNRLRKESLTVLEQMLLSPDSPLPSSTFTQRNKAILLNILNQADVTDTQERDFYLEEFDLLVDRYDHREWRNSALNMNPAQE